MITPPQAIGCECPVCALSNALSDILDGHSMATVWIALIDVLAQIIASTDDPREALDDCRKKLGDFRQRT